MSGAGWQALADRLVADGILPHLAVCRGAANAEDRVHFFGAGCDANSLFLTASLTKPVLAMAVLQLAAAGEISLEDPLSRFLTEFPALRESPGKTITIRHLLCHASGLVDQPPNGRELRRSHAELRDFFAAALDVGCDFAPGTSLRYQSMGYAGLGLMIERVCGQTCATFLDDQIFAPLKMSKTSLGIPETWMADGRADRVLHVELPPEQIGGDDWNWNSRWWSGFGAPWGGMISSAEDLAKFCRAMLMPGEWFSEAVITAATEPACEVFPRTASAKQWCPGWRPNWLGHRQTFGDFLPGCVIGHWGATGTLMWIDRQTDRFAVLLSTVPMTDEVHPLARLSNAISSEADIK